MKILAPGLRELARLATRTITGGRLLLDRRRLARLETALGLLGWQQAEYDAPTQEHVNRITHVEREQAQLTNESARLGIALQQIVEERATVRQRADEEQQSVVFAGRVAAANRAELQKLLTSAQQKKKQLEAKLPVFDRELKEADRNYHARAGKATRPALQAEVSRLEKLIQAIPRERDECQITIAQTSMGMAATQALLEAWDAAEDRFQKADAELAKDAAAKLKEKRRLEKQAEGLEQAKTHPYRAVGQALADNRVEPLNQPEALAAVLEQRTKIENDLAAIAASRAQSALENRMAVWQAWAILGGAVVVVLLVILVISSR